jgi:Putative metal-binding motif/Secretion system C-terminal sorting domain
LYKTVQLYGSNVKYYEIWNEPAFDYTGVCGWQPPGAACNWWDQNPDPCNFAIHAPVTHYVRMLRISWDIIKTLQPDALVTISGIGYDSFLDAILRNTDNPVNGSVTAEYPHGGGAYFDCIGYHSYPHIDGSLRVWSNAINGFVYYRHSDRAANGVITAKINSQLVLNNYGFNGTTYPLKKWIITECNIPRKAMNTFIGSAEAQRNFIIKSVVLAMQNGIDQIDWYSAAENASYANATSEFDLMGMYQMLNGTTLTSQVVNDEGKSSKTVSNMLYLTTFDAAKTAAMNLPSNVGGAACKNAAGEYTYVLWAKTNTDMSEVASASYTFPAAWNVGTLNSYAWDYGYTNTTTTSSPTSIALTGSPKFFRAQTGCGGMLTYFADADGDGFGNPNQTTLACTQPAGYVYNCSDCNDGSVAVNINVSEVTDGLDNDCNGLVDDVCGNIATMTCIKQSPTSVTLNWADIKGASLYDVQYRKVGVTAWSTALSTIPSHQLLTGLTAATNYEVRNRVKCNSNYTGYSTTFFAFTTPASTGTCNVIPTLGTAEIVSNTSVKLIWNFNYTSNKYELKYKTLAATTWTTLTVTNATNKIITGLLPGVGYVYKLRAQCPPGNSNWTASSIDGTFTMPGGAPPACVGQLMVLPSQNNQVTNYNNSPTDLNIQPNPTTGFFKATFDETLTERIQITDVAGKVYQTWQTPAADQLFDIINLPDGLYLVVLFNRDGSTLTSRLFKTTP